MIPVQKAVLLFVSAFVLLPLATQAQSDRLSFDVASVELSADQSVGHVGTIYTIPGGRFTANSVLLRVLIFNAYDLKESGQLIGGRDWINTIRWNIEA